MLYGPGWLLPRDLREHSRYLWHIPLGVLGATRRLVPMGRQQESIPAWDSGLHKRGAELQAWSKRSKSPLFVQ